MPNSHILQPRGTSQPYLTSRGAQGMAVSIIFTSLATFFVLARLYTRVWLMKRLEANDWMILTALAFSFVFMGFYIVEALNGMGMHGAAIPPTILGKQMKAFWLTIPLYNTAVLLAKATILMQYFRVFPTRRLRIVSWTMIAVLATYGTWCVISAFLNCIPVAKFWDPTIPGHCLSSKNLWYSNAGMHIATDLAILVIPVPALVRLNLPTRQKIVLMGIFALGGFVCVTSVCRLVSIKKIADSLDPTYDNVGAASWSAVECNVGIICACLPTLRPLVSSILPRFLSTISGSGTRRDGDTAPASSFHGQDSNRTRPRDEECGSPTEEAEKVLAILRGHGINGERFKEAVVNMEAMTDSSTSSSPKR